MCDEFDGWYERARIAEQLRKDREQAAAVKKQQEAATPAKPAATDPRVKEPETVPV